MHALAMRLDESDCDECINKCATQLRPLHLSCGLNMQALASHSFHVLGRQIIKYDQLYNITT